MDIPYPPIFRFIVGSSPKVGFGLYNSISAVEATVLELGMLILGAAVYAAYIFKQRRNTELHS